MARDLNFGTQPIEILMKHETALYILSAETIPKGIENNYALVEISPDTKAFKIQKVFTNRKPNLVGDSIPFINDEEILTGLAKSKLTNMDIRHFIEWIFK